MTRKTKLEKALATREVPYDYAEDFCEGMNHHAEYLLPLHEALVEAVEALEFYSNPNNWADVWCDEFVEREGDVAARIDYEDCERLTDGDGVYFGPAGHTAREALAKLDKAIDSLQLGPYCKPTRDESGA